MINVWEEVSRKAIFQKNKSILTCYMGRYISNSKQVHKIFVNAIGRQITLSVFNLACENTQITAVT